LFKIPTSFDWREIIWGEKLNERRRFVIILA
jgi:hypothetical protein